MADTRLVRSVSSTSNPSDQTESHVCGKSFLESNDNPKTSHEDIDRHAEEDGKIVSVDLTNPCAPIGIEIDVKGLAERRATRAINKALERSGSAGH